MNKVSRKDLGRYPVVHLTETKRLKVNGRWSKRMGKAPICVNVYPGKEGWDKFNVVGFNIIQQNSARYFKETSGLCEKCVKKYAKKKRKEDYPRWLKVYLGESKSVEGESREETHVIVKLPWGDEAFIYNKETFEDGSYLYILEVKHDDINLNLGRYTLHGFLLKLKTHNSNLDFQAVRSDVTGNVFIYRVWKKGALD